MNFYTARVPLTSQRPRHYTRAARKLYVGQVISRAGYFDRPSASGRVNAIVTIRSPDSRRQCRNESANKAEERVNLPAPKASNEAIRSPTKSAFRSPILDPRVSSN